jgi:hypothetical protein
LSVFASYVSSSFRSALPQQQHVVVENFRQVRLQFQGSCVFSLFFFFFNGLSGWVIGTS